MLISLPTPSSPSSRCFAPAESGGSPSAEDLQYFEAKGCFSLPSHQVCGQLLISYFEYVHPFVPVVDPACVLRVFDNGSDLRPNLLIFWSMFSAAASVSQNASGLLPRSRLTDTVCRTWGHCRSRLQDAERNEVINVPKSQGMSQARFSTQYEKLTKPLSSSLMETLRRTR